MSLAELEALEGKNPPPLPDIKDGDGTKTPADLEAERVKQLALAEEKNKNNPPAPTAEELAAKAAAEEETKTAARLAELKAKPVQHLSPEEKLELEKLEAPAEEELDDDPEAFWEDVDKLTGDPVEIDWTKQKDAEGNLIAADSPQGAAIRQKAVEERAVERYEAYLMEVDPRGYQYLLHRQAGGVDEDFFGRKTPTLPDYETFKESIDLQTAFYTRILMGKGVPEKQVKMIVDDAVKNKEIFALADKEYKATESAETAETRRLQNELERSQKDFNASVTILDRLINTEVASPKLKVVIPEAKRIGFASFVKSLVTYDEKTRQFAIVQPISKEALPRQLESLYLLHVNGDLGEVVKREAATAVTRKLRRAVDKGKDQARSQPSDANRKKTLGEI